MHDCVASLHDNVTENNILGRQEEENRTEQPIQHDALT
jgi:hypothetical protein